MNGRYTFYTTVIVLLTLLGAYLLYQLGQTIVVLFIAIIVASAIRPLVNLSEARGMNRGLAILLIYLSILGMISALLIVAIPPLVTMAMQLMEGDLLVRQVRLVAARLAVFGWDQLRIQLPVWEIPRQLQAFMEQAPEAAKSQALPVAQTAGTVLTNLLLALVMGFYWLTSRDKFLELLMRMSPLRHRERIRSIWNDVEETLGAWVRGQTILCLAIGVISWIGLALLGVQYAIPLAVIAGITEAIPMIGPIIGAVPAILVAFTQSPTLGLFVVIFYIIVQQLENNVLVPRIMERSVGLNPLIVILAIIAGGVLQGIVGGLLSIPVAAALQVIARHLLIEPALQNQAPRVETSVIFDDQVSGLTKKEPDELTIVVPASLKG